ncbi:MAG: ABC transporter permease [Anaerolineales bacterium]|jgi:ABC-type antimicrobial peptide transport system permease subunit
MRYFTLQDLRHDVLLTGFNILTLAALAFAFLLMVSLSISMTRFEVSHELTQTLFILQSEVISPEHSRVSEDLADDIADRFDERLIRLDPMIFRIIRVEGTNIELRGITQEAWLQSFHQSLLKGRWPLGSDEIIISQQLAQKTSWEPSDSVSIYGTDFRIVGISDGPGTNSQSVWMDHSTAVSLFGTDRGDQLLVANLHPDYDPVQTKLELESWLDRQGGFDVYLIQGLAREYGNALQGIRALSILLTGLGVGAITLGANNLAWLAAEERKNSLGVLRTLGFNPSMVSRYLILRALVVACIAYASAFGIAWLVVEYALGSDLHTIGATEIGLDLGPGVAFSGLALMLSATILGTWLSSRTIRKSPVTTLLDRGPGEAHR